MQFSAKSQHQSFLFLIALFLICTSHPAFAQTPKSYDLYMRLGQKAYQARDYQKALAFFKQAHLIHPSSLESVQYMDQIKRYIKDEETGIEIKPQPLSTKKSSVNHEDLMEEDIDDPIPAEIPAAHDENAQLYQENAQIIFAEDKNKNAQAYEEVLSLDDNLWQEQPNTRLSIELNRSIILEGRNIEKFLIITEGFIRAERLDQDRLRIVAQRRGETFLHVWEAHGRWTFNIETIFPLELTKGFGDAYEELTEESVKPFRFFYSNSWDTLYGGPKMSELTKQNLTFRQWMSVNGETPYGDSTASVHFQRFGNDYVATSYSAGLSRGHWGNFKDFSVRAFDTSRRFSELTLPGRSFRGIMFDSYAFHRKLAYTILEGRDQSSFANLTPGLVKKQKTFLEGARVTLFPENQNNYTINYARGYGANRSNELKDRVYSFETHNRLGRALIHSEIAHDEERWAGRLRSVTNRENSSFIWSLRDIEKDFDTITGRPSGSGEIGSNFNYEWRGEDRTINRNFTAFLDLYQDREQENPQRPHWINTDLSTSYDFNLNPKLRSRTSFYYSTTPQVLSSRTNVRLNQAFTKSFAWFYQQNASLTLGSSVQSSRFKLTPSSEFDRYELNASLQVPLIRHLYAFLNYEYSWVDEINTGEWSNPSVSTTGLAYSHPITDKLSINANTTYRNEEDTEGTASFLSGEDSLSTNVGFDYRVAPNTTVYLDGRLRNVHGEIADRRDYNEAELRLGLQSDWDLPFYWNPLGAVKGFVYFDANRNGKKDKEEKGIENVTVKVGKKTGRTNADGKYFVKVFAKKVTVTIDTTTLPQGAFFSTDSEFKADIDKKRIHRVDFGLTTQTGIYGVVYFDENGNGQLDSGDIYIPQVALKLDDQETATTDDKGGYNFYDVKPGKHTITLDVNSLPVDYLPLIKIKNKINVREGVTAIFNIPLKKR